MVFELSTVNLINTLIITTGIGVCGMCFLHITASVNLPQSFRRYFQCIFVTLSIYIATYLARRLIEGIDGTGVHIALHILPTVEITAAGLMTYLISRLLISITKPERSKLLNTVLHVLLLTHAAVVIAGSFSDVFFYINSANYYQRGSYYLLVNVLPLLMMVIDMALLVRYGRRITRRVRIAFWTYMILPLIAMLVQSLSYGIQYIAFASVVGSVFMYAVIVKEQMEQYEKQNLALSRWQSGLIMVLADLVESRDQCTGDHIRKTAEYTRIIMEQMRKDGYYKDQLTDAFMEDVIRSAPLHDIGKIHVPDAILNKPDKLTPEEFEKIKEHTTAGRDIIGKALDMVAEQTSGYLHEAQDLAYCHHEKWDGSGYPQGLAGEDIPLSARIMAVADVFDALVSKRSYKDEFPFDKAMDIICEGIGTHFDPKVAEAFVEAEGEVYRVTYDT